MMLRDGWGHGWPDGYMPDEAIVESSVDLPWRWLVLAGLAFFRGVTLEDGGEFEPSELWFLLGVAALVAFFGNWMQKLGRKRQRKRQTLADLTPLMTVLRDYGVEELGGFYLYMPSPARPEDGEARAWLRVMKAKQLVISGPWRLEACRAPPWLRKSHPRICSDNIVFYNVYRLKRDPLAAFV